MRVPALEKMMLKRISLTIYQLKRNIRFFLAKNKRYGRIEENLKEENSSLLQIYVLISVAPIFAKFLTVSI